MSMNPNRNWFKEFPNRVFIETGTWRGDSIQYALDAGFSEIFSIDSDPEAIAFCNSRFYGHPQREHIHLELGYSHEVLPRVLPIINEPITFWLDAHWEMIEGTNPGPAPFPLIEELETIKHCGGKHNHTILIDDMHIMYPDVVGYNKTFIKAKLLSINPQYKFYWLASPLMNDILAAHTKELWPQLITKNDPNRYTSGWKGATPSYAYNKI